MYKTFARVVRADWLLWVTLAGILIPLSTAWGRAVHFTVTTFFALLTLGVKLRCRSFIQRCARDCFELMDGALAPQGHAYHTGAKEAGLSPLLRSPRLCLAARHLRPLTPGMLIGCARLAIFYSCVELVYSLFETGFIPTERLARDIALIGLNVFWCFVSLGMLLPSLAFAVYLAEEPLFNSGAGTEPLLAGAETNSKL